MKSFDINDIQLKIQSGDVAVPEQVKNELINRIEKLGKINPNINKCEIIIRKEKSNKDKEYMIESKLFVPGATFFTKQQESSFEISSKKMFDDLRDQLLRNKEKVQHL